MELLKKTWAGPAQPTRLTMQASNATEVRPFIVLPFGSSCGISAVKGQNKVNKAKSDIGPVSGQAALLSLRTLVLRPWRIWLEIKDQATNTNSESGQRIFQRYDRSPREQA